MRARPFPEDESLSPYLAEQCEGKALYKLFKVENSGKSRARASVVVNYGELKNCISLPNIAFTCVEPWRIFSVVQH